MKILMISTEYPPMKGGVAHYSQKLVGSLRNEGMEVSVVCNEDGNGDFIGISPYNRHNSDVLLKAVKEFKPDVVHVQYEPGLYGIYLDPINPKRTRTNIESFYYDCKLSHRYYISFCLYICSVDEINSSYKWRNVWQARNTFTNNV